MVNVIGLFKEMDWFIGCVMIVGVIMIIMVMIVVLLVMLFVELEIVIV